MGGLLTCRQCSTRMESPKDHSFWDICRTCVLQRVRNYFCLLLVIVIVLILSFIYCSRAPPELVRKCPKDQAKLLHNISQLEAEKVTLKEQLIKMEKKMQNVMNQTQEKSLQLLEKKQETDALSKELSGFNQSLALTRQLLEKEKEKAQSLQNQLEKEKEKAQSLQNQLEKEKEDLQKIQQQRDSWQKQLNTLEEKLKSPDSKTKEHEEEIKHLKEQLSNLQQKKDQQQKEIQDLEDQLTKHKPLERSKGDLLLGPSMVLLPLLLAALLL